ncbi:MAG TPA: hypothetical protein VKY74_12165 [Chloroflexia bacterium]|nr:hypothetical protein [Chloroflexia bacterium]
MASRHVIPAPAHATPAPEERDGPQDTAALRPTPPLAALIAGPDRPRRGTGPLRPAALLPLQQAQGNQATRRLLQRLAVQRDPAPAAPAAAAPAAAAADDADIDALDLAATAKAGAQALKKAHPGITFTSGRRDVASQTHAMASNIVSSKNRNWIADTYAAAPKLQKWVDDNPKATTVDEIATGLETTMNAMSDDERGKVSKHLSGEAFDVQPQTTDADKIKATIKGLTGLSKFLEKEGGLVRWHAQF